MRLIASALLALALSRTGARAEAETLKVGYDITLAGLVPRDTPESLSSTFDGSKYKMVAAVKLSGLAKMLTREARAPRPPLGRFPEQGRNRRLLQ